MKKSNHSNTVKSRGRATRKTFARVFTIAQIEAAYDAEWVLVADPTEDENLQVTGGTVVFHSKDRDEVYQRAVELKLRKAATLYTGTLPEGTAVVL